MLNAEHEEYSCILLFKSLTRDRRLRPVLGEISVCHVSVVYMHRQIPKLGIQGIITSCSKGFHRIHTQQYYF